MNKSNVNEIMRPQYKALFSKNGIDYESQTISIFDMVRICDYYYRDLVSETRKLNIPKGKEIPTPVYFHHNNYWIVDGTDLSRVITHMTLIHRKDWRKVVSGKWRLQPDWLSEWYNRQQDDKGE